jgi:hypothetical protein
MLETAALRCLAGMHSRPWTATGQAQGKGPGLSPRYVKYPQPRTRELTARP